MQTLRGSELDGRYRLLEPVGRGGMATVWRARDRRLGRDVAVKLIAEARLDEPGFIERFEQEAQIAARLSHPNLVGVHDLRIDAGQPYLVMEFVEGETLDQRLERAPETVDTVELARTMLDVLAAIHDEGVIHRDLKPGNVMYQDDGRIRLTDFGIARIIGSTTITEAGHVIGTLEYMAPEVRSGETPTPAADLYALGVMLAKCGADTGPLADLVRRLRSADPAKRPESARLALISIAGLGVTPRVAEAPEPETEVVEPEPEPETRQREPAEVLVGAPHPDPEPTPAHAAPAEPPPPARESRGVPTPALIGAALAAIAALVLVLSLAGGGDEDPTREGNRQASGQSDKGSKEQQAAAPAEEEPTAATPVPEKEPADPVASTGDDSATGSSLNAQGYEMLQAGDAEGAVPILEEAAASWPEGTTDLEYAYTIFNLAVAYTDTGQPEKAIPLLEERLKWDDQRSTVRAELERAQAEAG